MANEVSFPKLFEPAYIGKVKLKNRLVMLPMGTAFGSPSGEVTQRTIDHYVERAKGGVGLITVGNISPYLPASAHSLVLDSDYMLMGHYELVEKVHAHGAKIIAQLNHPGSAKSKTIFFPGEESVSSSPLPTVYVGMVYPTPRALNKEEIYQMIERYVSAAARAKMVGYDMIELHGAHGYLVTQFISPLMNKRTDEFGGSLENRMRFALELIKAVRQGVGPDFPVGIRISAVEFVPGGVTLEESASIAQMLEAAGVAYISVSAGVFASAHKMLGLMSHPEGWKEYIWESVKKVVNLPTVAGGDLKHPEFCQRVLEEKKADFIGLARCLLADPDWPRKAMEGRVEDIRLCISCLECLMGSPARRRGGGARRCTVNADSGREREFAEIIPASKSKKVMVIGGGPGGMEAARIAAARGHKVTLYEKDESLGGQMLLAGRPQSRSKVLWLRDYLTTQLKKLGVKVELGVEVTPGLVEEVKPDTVVVATGAEPITPNIPGISYKTVMTAWDLMQKKVILEKEKVAVVGGGLVGCEVADYLLELQNMVTIIEQLPAVATDMEPHHKVGILELFGENNVTILTKRKVIGIAKKGVEVVNLDSGKNELVEADWVVIAVGSKPVDTLTDVLKNKVPELYSVGDCIQPRVILEAIYEGSLVGRQI
jgi:2,4-dienoyl-CoA reductase-like NADH-dependent reductase (Old Yellow Enzyme family)/thioredoxin reductase